MNGGGLWSTPNATSPYTYALVLSESASVTIKDTDILRSGVDYNDANSCTVFTDRSSTGSFTTSGLTRIGADGGGGATFVVRGSGAHTFKDNTYFTYSNGKWSTFGLFGNDRTTEATVSFEGNSSVWSGGTSRPAIYILFNGFTIKFNTSCWIYCAAPYCIGGGPSTVTYDLTLTKGQFVAGNSSNLISPNNKGYSIVPNVGPGKRDFAKLTRNWDMGRV